MFLGTHAPRLDEKGRLFLPAKFRDELSDGVVITRGQERCLYVWPRAEFLRFTEQLRGRAHHPPWCPRLRPHAGCRSERRDTGQAGPGHIPGGLRGYAGLERDCTVVGAMTRVEIWDAGAWETYQSEKEPLFADISEEVLPGIF